MREAAFRQLQHIQSWLDMVWCDKLNREEKFAYQYRVPPTMFMGRNITGTNDFACFCQEIIWIGGAHTLWKMSSSRYEDLISKVKINEQIFCEQCKTWLRVIKWLPARTRQLRLILNSCCKKNWGSLKLAVIRLKRVLWYEPQSENADLGREKVARHSVNEGGIDNNLSLQVCFRALPW